MRWDEQRVENDLRLPGVGAGTIVRTFDAPEAMGINFHEVRAQSALNHVAGTRYGFNWTINPYRGCTHACVYCMSGETPILMGDGATKPLSEIAVGDEIYGTVRRGNYRRYIKTRVEAHWQTRKEAYRVMLEDGTELIASGDHRFLTNRGWKYVIGAEQGLGQRPFLTTDDKLLGLGSLGRSLEVSEEYRLGYLCGMIRGDGHVGSYSYVRPGRISCDVHRFRLALTNTEALHRSRDYLAAAGVRTQEFQCLQGDERRLPTRGIRASSKDGEDRVRSLIRWPRSPSSEWSRGFLAGIFDAEGGRSEALRICSKELGVVSIEPLGREMEMYDITTGTGDFIANGVVSHNCFARRTHTYLDMDAGRDFEREIVVKVNVPELLRAELARPGWKRELVALGTNTDPYQWVESRYRMMPEILAALEAAQTPVSVLTKSPLVLRDIEIYERMAKKLPVSVNLSIPTLDEKAWRATEPHTPSPSARLDAVAELRSRGIDSGVLIAPLMPGINDDPDQVQPLVERAKEAGATFLGGVALHLRDGVKDVFMAWLQEKRPDLIPQYEELYKGRAYMRPEDRKRATRAVKGWGRSGARRRSPSPVTGPARQERLF